MGLDMYLTKKYYIGAQFDWNKIAGTVDLYSNGEKYHIKLNEIQEICCSAAYWRKANQIHAWFVKNVQDGKDECNEHYVSKKQLVELRELCMKVLMNHSLAQELLPTNGGFFFGSIDYDEEYFKDLENTVIQIGKLNLLDDWRFSYYYQSSW